jgi:tetratricopeptide (TPR) repeat protein
MRLILTVLVAGLLLSPPLRARAEMPSADRITVLFSQLQETRDPAVAAPLMQEIWQIWDTAPGGHADVQLLMDSAADYIRHEEYRQSLLALDSVHSMVPHYPEAWNRRALALYKAGELDAAVTAIARTLRLEPRHFGALSGLGDIHLAQGRLSQALTAFESALKVNPHLTYARRQVAAIREVMRRTTL